MRTAAIDTYTQYEIHAAFAIVSELNKNKYEKTKPNNNKRKVYENK